MTNQLTGGLLYSGACRSGPARGGHMFLRKALAGNTSSGYDWPFDGAIREVPDAHGFELLRIPDGGFTLVNSDQLPPHWDRDTEDLPDDGDTEVTEPGAPDGLDEAPKRRGRPPKTTVAE